MSSTIYNGRVISPTRHPKSMGRSLSGVFPVRGQGVYYESSLERDFIRIWSLSPEVVALVAQPVQIPFTAQNGRNYIHTPDFFVHFDECSGLKPLLVEVKHREDWEPNWREWSFKWKAARRYAREQGWRFRIFDESRIRGPRLSNVDFLQRYRNLSFDPAFTKAVLETVSLMGAAPFHYLIARLFSGNESIGRSHLWHLIATGQLLADLGKPLDDHTIVRTRDA